MQTSLDCVPCFFKQALDTARLTQATPAMQKQILQQLAVEIRRFDFCATPTQMGRKLYALVAKTTGNKDPFKEIKRKSNELALSLYPRLKEKIAASSDRLLTALELAIAGNIIDYGIKHLDVEQELNKIFLAEDRIIRREDKRLFAYSAFKKALHRAKNILYIADNAGEIVFDRVLLEELPDKRITFAVRAKPIINDALKEDALFCGIDRYARVVSSGSDAPGAILKFCSPAFRRIFHQAELIISKGQGNFEALNHEPGPIFFLFRAKCPTVSWYLKCKLGDAILKQQKVVR